LDHENENEEIDHNSSVLNDVPNVSNIENLGDGYENKIPHFDIYDPRNWENLHNNSNYIIVKKEPIKKWILIFPMTNILGISHM